MVKWKSHVMTRVTHAQHLLHMRVQSVVGVVGLNPIVRWENEKKAKRSLVEVYKEVSKVTKCCLIYYLIGFTFHFIW